MKKDSQVTIQKLKLELSRFRDQRGWKKFHDVKNLAEAISIESAELLELFLWKNQAEIDSAIRTDKGFRREIENELADVLCFCLNMANSLDLDIATIVRRKIKENGKKYPISKSSRLLKNRAEPAISRLV
jgi:NTP pyrophosphatase (non-canonical NTP hydrolase)